jgi:capsular polysaccharide biosynthesis protein
MEQTNNNTQNDVIDLRELFSVLKRRKKLIGIVTGLLTILAIIYAFFVAKPIYEITGIMEVARIDKKPVQDINNLKQRLKTLYDVDRKGKKIEFPIVSKINIPKTTTNLLKITTQGYSNDTAEQKLKEVISYITLHQNEQIKNYISMQKQKLQLNQNEIKKSTLLEEEIKQDMINYKNQLQNISKEDAALAGIYSIEIGKKQSELNSLSDRKYKITNRQNDLELSISPMKIEMAQSIKTEISDHSVKPKKKLIVVVAFITGLMLSIFLAFFLEFISGMKREEDSEQ